MLASPVQSGFVYALVIFGVVQIRLNLFAMGRIITITILLALPVLVLLLR